jgi:cytochrome c5
VSHADDIFYRQFGFILVLLILFTLMAGVLANSIGGDALFRISQSQDAVLDRIKPIGSVDTAVAAPKVEATAAAKPTAKTTVAAAPAAPKPTAAAEPVPALAGAMDNGGAEGRKTYMTACLACHAVGVANAPKFGDNAAWAKRAEQGLEALYASGINGKGQLMPGKGGNTSLSDNAVKAAVRYMLSESGVTAK